MPVSFLCSPLAAESMFAELLDLLHTVPGVLVLW